MLGREIGGLARLGFGIPAFEFQEHGSEQFILGQASHASSFADRSHEGRGVAPLRCPAQPAV